LSVFLSTRPINPPLLSKKDLLNLSLFVNVYIIIKIAIEPHDRRIPKIKSFHTIPSSLWTTPRRAPRFCRYVP